MYKIPWFDCVDVQADLSLSSPDEPNWTFGSALAYLICTVLYELLIVCSAFYIISLFSLFILYEYLQNKYNT